MKMFLCDVLYVLRCGYTSIKLSNLAATEKMGNFLESILYDNNTIIILPNFRGLFSHI